jgi:hypothetical protein
MAEFANWAVRLLAGDPTAHLAQGEALAWRRREALRELIATNPAQALAHAVPFHWRAELPPRITRHFERRVDARGDLVVAIGTDLARQRATTYREAETAGERFQVFVQGRREALVTQTNVPLHGIAIDGRLALLNEPLRPLEPVEAAALAEARGRPIPEVCAVCAAPAPAEVAAAVTTEAGGELLRFCCAEHAGLVDAHWTLLEDGGSGIGPLAISAADSQWTHGPKRVLYMRVNFPDDLTTPVSEAGAYAVMDSVNTFYVESSYHATDLTTVVTPLVTLPQSKAWYSTAGPGALLADARETARRAGFDTRNYDLDIVCHTSVPGFDWAGLGVVRGKGTWLQSAGFGVTAHELGHNYGLGHANWWDTLDQGSVTGFGINVEYGNNFDTMGSGGGHFNAYFKNRLGWLPDPAVLDVISNGVYRLHAFDTPVREAGLSYAVQVRRDALRDYWLELRERFPGNPWTTHGALLNWTPWPYGGGGSKLLDVTPGSPSASESREDAALVIGRTLSDVPADLHLTPLRRGQTGTNVWLEVQIESGAAATNRPPQVRLEVEHTNAAPGDLVHFRAEATDPDGDELAYAWHFEDLSFPTNQLPWTFKRWDQPGEYLVRCVVSDRRGGATSAQAVVNIGGAPGLRVSGRVVDLEGNPIPDVRVHNGTGTVADYRGGVSGPEGEYVIPRPTTDLSLYAVKPGWVFTNANWDNPLIVTSSLPDVNFVGLPLPVVSLTPGTTNLTENGATSGQIRVQRTGVLNEPLQVALHLDGTATLDTDYWLEPVLASGSNAIVIPADDAFVDITFGLRDDNAIEGQEAFSLTLLEGAELVDGAPVVRYVVGAPGEAVVTILDNDAPARPTVNVSTGTPSVGEAGMDRGELIITRNGPTEASLTVFYLVSGSATPGVDYPTLPGVVVIPAGSRTGSVFVRPADDKAVEPDETVIVSVAPHAAYLLGGTAAQVAIRDDDLLTVTITPTGAGAAEPAEPGRFTVLREGDLSANLQVNYTISGVATEGVDYEFLPGLVTIPTGAASASITLVARDDLLVEGDESVSLTLVTNTAYNVGTPATAMLFIRDNERPTVTVNAPDATASEPGFDTGRFTVSRGAVTASPLTVHLALSGSALAGADYVPLELPVVIPDGQSSVSFEVIPFDDLHVEYDETVILTLLPGTNYNLGTPARAVVTISDDDLFSVPAVGFTFAASAVEERLSPGISVSLSATSMAPVTVEFRVLGGTAGTNDYAPAAGSVSFAPGEWAKSFPFAIADNTTPQPDRTVRLVLFNPSGATLDGNKFHTYTILDDDTATVTVTAPTPATAESGGPPGSFRISRSGATNAALLVNFEITGSASAPADYPPLGTSVVIPAGATFVNLPVAPVADGVAEFSETVVLTLISAPGGRLVSPNVATVTISDHDTETRPLVAMSAAARSYAVEGGGAGEVVFSREGPLEAPLTLHVTFTGSAVNGVDYRWLTNVLIFPAGQATATLTVSAVNDTEVEGDETLFVSLTTRDTYRVAQPGHALVVIQDNDQRVRVHPSDFLAAEPGTDPGEFTFTRFGTTNDPVTVRFALSGTASNGLDYAALTNSFVIPAGQLSAALPVLALDDLLIEGPETVTLRLLANADYELGAPTTATVTIDDDEPMVIITAPVPTVMEGSPDPGVFRITRTGDPKYDFTVKVAVSGTAAFGVDYPPFRTNILFTCGMIAVDLLVFPTNELVVEGLETVRADLVPDPAYTILTPSNAVVTIEDAGVNLAPLVTITSPSVPTVFLPGDQANILLEATVTDDDTNTAPNLVWSQITGPVAFSFGPTNEANTTASFGAPGVYLLRLTADDGVLTNRAEVRVAVGPLTLLATNLLHWTLDDGNGDRAADSSGAGRDGLLTGAAAWETNGVLGGAVRLPGGGAQVREAVPSGFLEGLPAFSLALWLKRATTNTEQGFFTAHAEPAGPTLSLAARSYSTCGQATNVLEATVTTTKGFARHVTRSDALTSGWQHLVLTWSNGLAPALFINGQLDRAGETMAPLSGLLTNVPDFLVGLAPAELAAGWDGWVDDVRLFPRALHAGEVAALAALPPANWGALVDAGEDVTLQRITPGTLAGTVSDDDNPIPPGLLSNVWVQVAGPVPMTLTNAQALTNTIQFLVAGEYVFRLIGDDARLRCLTTWR